MLILNMCPFVKLYHSSPGIRKLLLTNQNPLAFNSCSLTYHFTRLILSFQIGSNNISIFMGIMNKTLLVFGHRGTADASDSSSLAIEVSYL